MQTFDKAALEAMNSRYRVNFINCLSGYKSLNLVGTINAQGQTNLAPFSSVIHLGADPALVGMICRPPSETEAGNNGSGRHTLDNLIATGWYTLNHVSAEMVESAHQCSARYPAGISEFDASGLTPEFSGECPAPFVAESRLRMAVHYREHHELLINGTTLIIGEIMSVTLPDDVLRESGYIDLDQAGTLSCTGLDSYHTGQRLLRLAYAKPDQAPRQIPEDS